MKDITGLQFRSEMEKLGFVRDESEEERVISYYPRATAYAWKHPKIVGPVFIVDKDDGEAQVCMGFGRRPVKTGRYLMDWIAVLALVREILEVELLNPEQF